MSLEDELHAEMENGYQRAGREIGYWANYFIRDLRVEGAVGSAKKMLRPQKKGGVHRGLQRLLDAGRTDIALEHIVLQERFRHLFTEAELAEAQRRVDSFPVDLRRRKIPPEESYPETVPSTRTYTEGTVKQVLVNVHERSRAAVEKSASGFTAPCARRAASTSVPSMGRSGKDSSTSITNYRWRSVVMATFSIQRMI